MKLHGSQRKTEIPPINQFKKMSENNNLDYVGLEDESGISSNFNNKYESLKEFWSESESTFYEKSADYWKEKVTNDMNGMLGGYTNVHERDIRESSALLSKVLVDVKPTKDGDQSHLYCFECGR